MVGELLTIKVKKSINLAGWVTLTEPGEVIFENRVSKPSISVYKIVDNMDKKGQNQSLVINFNFFREKVSFKNIFRSKIVIIWINLIKLNQDFKH